MVCDTKVALNRLVVKEKVLGVRLDCEANLGLENWFVTQKWICGRKGFRFWVDWLKRKSC